MDNNDVIKFLNEDLEDMYSDDEKMRRPYYEHAIKVLKMHEEFTKRVCSTCIYKDYFDDNVGVLGYWKQIIFSTYPQIEPDVFECSCCRFQVNNRKYNYCPDCGAYMREEANNESNK